MHKFATVLFSFAAAAALASCTVDESTAEVVEVGGGSQGGDAEIAVQEPRDDYSQFSPGLRALLEDVRDGRLNEQPFVNHGYAKLGWQGNPPRRYRDDSITDPERAVLALAIEQVLAPAALGAQRYPQQDHQPRLRRE